MRYEKENLTKLLVFIKEIANEPENEWFKEKLLNSIHKTTNTIDYGGQINNIKKDTQKIVEFLAINPDCSIDYSFIGHKLLRTRLELDNLRMENIRYDLKEKDEMKRLYDFCINAFYQVENLINYYFYEKFPKVNDLLNHLESIPNTKFKRKEEKNIGDINIFTKIYTFNKTFYQDDPEFIGYNIDSLRLIRNEGLHRCSRIKNVENENKRLHQFIKYATFDSIYSLVNSLAIKINYLLQNK